VDLVIRGFLIFSVVFLVMRVIGRRELNSLEPFDIIVLVVIGDLIQQGVTQNDLSVTGALIVLFTLSLLVVGYSYLGYRLPVLRPVLRGEPLVLVENGEPVEPNLKRQRLTLDEVLAEARGQQIGTLGEIRLAVLETSGKISFLPVRAE
jgi:uncharacterized membrane protein YcaP (DUF421 family)